MNKTLTFEDFDKIHNRLIEVEKIINEQKNDLAKCNNHTDLSVLLRINIKLNEIENIIIDECQKRGL